MIYEISNPSDAYTMKSDDPAAACVACLLLGEGAYGLEDEKNHIAWPIMLFGGDPNATLKSLHGITFDEFMESPDCHPRLVAALDSVLIGSRINRQAVENSISAMSPEDAAVYLAEYHDRRRSSLNNIGRRAKLLSAHFANAVAAE